MVGGDLAACLGDNPDSELPVDVGNASVCADACGKSYLTLSSRCGGDTGRHKGMGWGISDSSTAHLKVTGRHGLSPPCASASQATPTRERTHRSPVAGGSRGAACHGRGPAPCGLWRGHLWAGLSEPGPLGLCSAGPEHPIVKPDRGVGGALGRPGVCDLLGCSGRGTQHQNPTVAQKGLEEQERTLPCEAQLRLGALEILRGAQGYLREPSCLWPAHDGAVNVGAAQAGGRGRWQWGAGLAGPREPGRRLTSSSWLCTCCTIRSMATVFPLPGSGQEGG